jgi:hypothetical protein
LRKQLYRSVGRFVDMEVYDGLEADARSLVRWTGP